MDLLKIYKSFQKHNSIFIPKKKVVFIIESGKQIFAEFSDTTNIISLKKYIEKFVKKKKVDLVYNGCILKDNLYLGDLCYNNPNIKRLFFRVIKNNTKKKIIEEYKKDINNFEENNKQLNNELVKLKKESNTKEYSNKISEEKCKNINAIYLKNNNKINELKKELKQINNDINIMTFDEKNNRNDEQYSIEKNDNFEIKTYNYFLQKSDSIIYSINGRNNHSRNIGKIKSQ